MSSIQAATNEQIIVEVIRSRRCPSCYLCGAQGERLYEGLRDRLFDAPGTWNFKRCPSPACGLVWLDPMPSEEDIGKAYTTYYTHQQKLVNKSGSNVGSFLKSGLVAIHDLLLRLTPVHRERKRLAHMYLGAIVPGKLLEIGCGDGSRLARFWALGWEVQGQEVDPKAASQARDRHGVPVHLGPLEEAAFPDAGFDAIIMNHVIEHVYDPVRLLAECNRILRAGGTLLAITPNTESYGHKRFGSSWRGLEPPRHLFLFSQQTLRETATKAGFSEYDVWTTPAHAAVVAQGSLQILAGREQHTGSWYDLSRGILIAAYEIWMTFMYSVDNNSGEECVLRATK